MASAATYAFTGKAIPASDRKGQKGLVVAALENGPATVATIAERIKAELVTVQTPERIAAYYVCVLKKSGHVAELAPDAKRTADDVRAEIARLGARMDELDAELATILEAETVSAE